jgi:hypothetical protein
MKAPDDAVGPYRRDRIGADERAQVRAHAHAHDEFQWPRRNHDFEHFARTRPSRTLLPTCSLAEGSLSSNWGSKIRWSPIKNSPMANAGIPDDES